ncbi:B12-binding domain-containing radical SAM protein [Desulfomonile tiedjei]|uniref:Fe-S oxidoreductase n=1 Tax=Desulfomonile tiedjei (strain ATCC 49306 / DSM 6799 / DCB-1) TaxID=706587 RepID=I4C8V3_DESTA|nr:B12-binding domain-containing radical SAM protein [Desulfomonile tiedjei]AFM25994.1 Fe-S oxidoreductase [Desulfomonile tiedjei DSM 6799]
MNVLLVYPKSPRNLNIGTEDSVIRVASKKAYTPPLGLLTVAALLPHSWDLKLIDLTFQCISEEDWAWCETVFTTGTLMQFTQIADVIRESKEKGKVVAVGGPAAFHFPHEFVNVGADYVAVGEGEITIPLLLEKMRQDAAPTIIRSAERADLTMSPVPRFDLLDMKAYVDMAIQFSRGCPFQCEFCDATQIFGREVRTKTPEQFIRELQTLYDLGWRREIYVVDDNFVGNPKRSKALLEMMVTWSNEHRRPFEFFTHASINLSRSPDIMRMMVEAGFTTVYIGIESTDKEVLRIARKLQNSSTDLDDACSKINEAGLQIMAGTILGMDGERPGRDRSLIEFVSKNNIPLVEVALLYAYPGTSLWTRLKRENRLVNGEREDLIQSNNLRMNFRPTRSLDEIETEFLNTMSALYDHSAFLDRAFRHFLAMKPVQMPLYPKKLEWAEIRVLIITFIQWGFLRNTRTKFWRILVRAYTKMDLRRFLLLIRCCVALEHYVGIYNEFLVTLRPTTAK